MREIAAQVVVSHEFRSSDNLFCDFYRTNGVVSNMNDNARLSDIIICGQAVRLIVK